MEGKITPDAYFIMAIGMSVLSDLAFPFKRVIPYPYSIFGAVLLILGVYLVYISNSFLLTERTSVRPFEDPKVLLTSGPFRFSRNPIYLGMALALFGIAVLLGSLSALLFPILFLLIMDQLIIPGEEDKLTKVFGKKYIDYRKQVRRWI